MALKEASDVQYVFLVQGDKPDAWFTARPWEVNLLTSAEEGKQVRVGGKYPLTFRLEYETFAPAAPHTIGTPDEFDTVAPVIRNMNTGRKRLVRQLAVPVWTHTGALCDPSGEKDALSTATLVQDKEQDIPARNVRNSPLSG